MLAIQYDISAAVTLAVKGLGNNTYIYTYAFFLFLFFYKYCSFRFVYHNDIITYPKIQRI